MPKLCQIIAVEKGLKTRAYDEVKKVHHEVQKSDLLSGFSRTYTPFSDTETERLPSETKVVQLKATEAIKRVNLLLAEAFNAVATKEWGNQQAKADIVVDGGTLVKDAPVAYLLYLEHQLDDLKTFVDKLPTLDPAEVWSWDENQALYATTPSEVLRTKKVPTVIVKAPATEHHQAQTEIYPEDKPVGVYRTVKRSGALPVQKVQDLREKVLKLQQAVKFAREQANTIDVTPMTPGNAILGFLFGT